MIESLQKAAHSEKEEQNTRFLNPTSVLEKVNIRSGMRVADLGCGTGYMTIAAARLVGTSGRVYAFDVQKELLKYVLSAAELSNLTNVETRWANVELPTGTKLPAESMDMTLLVNLLFLVVESRRVRVWEEAKRITKHGSQIIVVEWKLAGIPIGPQPRDRIAPEDVKKDAISVGVNFVGEFEASAYHYGLKFLR